MRRACGGSGKASASLCFVIGDGLFSWPGVQCVGGARRFSAFAAAPKCSRRWKVPSFRMRRMGHRKTEIAKARLRSEIEKIDTGPGVIRFLDCAF